MIEGTRERIQAFEGVCIARKNAGINSAFTVRKISYGEGVERVFPLHSTSIDSIEVTRRGDVRRAKLYYLRGLTGKRARITEKTDWSSTKKTEATSPEEEIKSITKSEEEPDKVSLKEKKNLPKKKKASVKVAKTEKEAKNPTSAPKDEAQEDKEKDN